MSILFRAARLGVAFIIVVSAGFHAAGAETSVIRTNWVERSITNLIEVRMPANRFVNEFHTNRVELWRTNVFEAYATNRLVRTLTNTVTVDVFHTNFVTVSRTNRSAITLTNEVAVNLIRTNFVDKYRTNWQTLTFTNWQTVLVMKTNWVIQPVTNVVQLDAVASRPKVAAPKETAEPIAPRADVAPAILTDSLIIETARAARPSGQNLLEVRLKVRWAAGTGTPQVIQWRIEREDGAISSFGQEQEFTGDLPAGNYRVEARVQKDGASPVLLTRSTLAVTAREAVVQPKAAARKLAGF